MRVEEPGIQRGGQDWDTTVVICCFTADRWEDLGAAIASVEAQQPRPGLTVVVDHDPDLLDRIRASYPGVDVLPSEDAPGLSGARNTGLRHVRSPLVAFLDDDARARPGWLRALTAPFADSSVVGVGGKVEPRWDGARPAWFPPEFDWVVGCTYAGCRTDAGPIRNPLGANMAFRTQAIRSVGGFSDQLGRVGVHPLGCEETEACIRMAHDRPDAVVWYSPQAVVDHRVRPVRASWRYFMSRCFAEGRSKAALRRLTHQRLASEREYVRAVLPRAVLNGLLRTHAREPGALQRAGAVMAGLASTTLGYVGSLAVGAARARGGPREPGWTWFDIHDSVTVRVVRWCPAERQLREMLRPFLVPAQERTADISVGTAPVRLLEPSYGEHAYRFTESAVEVVDQQIQVGKDRDGFSLSGSGELLTALVPLIDRVAVLNGAAMVHAAMVSIGGVGVCLPAWGGVGKTSTVAKLAARPDGAFMGDDWGFVDRKGRLLGYAKPMFLKPHHRPIYPDAFEKRHKPLAPSAFTDSVARLATMVHPIIIRHPVVADITRRWSPEHMMVRPDQVFPSDKIVSEAPLGLVCFVERFDGRAPETLSRSVDWMADRMVGNFHAELPRSSRELVTALGSTGLVGINEYFAAKDDVIRAALTDVPLWSLRVPAAMSASDASDVVAKTVVTLMQGNRP